jgi:hypothetical protein
MRLYLSPKKKSKFGKKKQNSIRRTFILFFSRSSHSTLYDYKQLVRSFLYTLYIYLFDFLHIDTFPSSFSHFYMIIYLFDFFFQMSISCPVWSNVRQVVAELKTNCPPEYKVVNVSGVKSRDVVPCHWTVHYLLVKDRRRWHPQNFVAEMMERRPRNLFAHKMNVIFDGPDIFCEHIMYLRCRDGSGCIRGGLQHLMQGYRPELHHVDDVAVQLFWPEEIRVIVESVDEGYCSGGEDNFN